MNIETLEKIWERNVERGRYYFILPANKKDLDRLVTMMNVEVSSLEVTMRNINKIDNMVCMLFFESMIKILFTNKITNTDGILTINIKNSFTNNEAKYLFNYIKENYYKNTVFLINNKNKIINKFYDSYNEYAIINTDFNYRIFYNFFSVKNQFDNSEDIIVQLSLYTEDVDLFNKIFILANKNSNFTENFLELKYLLSSGDYLKLKSDIGEKI